MRRLLPVLLIGLLAVLTPLRSAAASAPQWFEVTSPHFRVVTDSSEKRGREVALQLERMRSVFQALLPAGADASEPPITVLALKNKKDFAAVEPAAYLAKNQLNLAGYFQRTQDKNYILLRLDADAEHPYAPMYHEYAHYTMRKAGEWLPLWLNEGQAQFYQNSDIHEKDVLLGRPSPEDLFYLREHRLISLPVLFAVDHTSPYYHDEQKGSVFYAESWALTHYLINSDWGKPRNRLSDYMHLLKAKTDPSLAAQQAFGDLRQLQKDLDMYVAHGEYKVFEAKMAVSVDATSFQSQPIAEAAADALRADVLAYSDRKPEARALIATVLQADPKNAQAHETMGYLSLREGDNSAARKWYGEAVQLDSQSYFAHYYYALTSLQSREGDATQIESSLRAAIRLNPSFAPSYDLLAHVLAEDPAKKAEAHMMNVQAIGLEPDNLTYRLNAASVLISTQQFDSAIRVLETAKHVAKSPDDQQRIDQQLTMLAHYNDRPENHAPVHTDGVTLSAKSFPRMQRGASARTMAIPNNDGSMYLLKEDSAAPAEATVSASASAETAADTPAVSGHHSVQGVIRSVTCVFPSKLTLTVAQSDKGPDVTLTTANFFKLEISAVNYTPQGDMNPCNDLKDTKAKVDYADAAAGAPGVIVSIALSR